MLKPSKPKNESTRLLALESLGVLDSVVSIPGLSNLTELAADFLDVPICLVSLVDEKRQWFACKVGLDANETSREVSFCGHAILEKEAFIVEDARLDERFHDNPLVTGEPRVVFYAGFQLVLNDGSVLGTLCVIDHKPRKLSSEHFELMSRLAKQTVTCLESHSRVAELNLYSHMMEEIHQLNLVSGLSVKDLCLEYLSKGSKVLDLEYGIVSKVRNDYYEIQEVIGPQAEDLQGFKAPLEDTYCREVIEKKQTITYVHVGADERMCQHPVYINMKLECFVGVPIRLGEEVFGTLNFSSTKVRRNGFSTKEIKFVEILGEAISQRLELMEAEREKEKMHKELEAREKRHRLVLEILGATSGYIHIQEVSTRATIFQNDELKFLLEKRSPKVESITHLHPAWAKTILSQEALPSIEATGSWRGESSIEIEPGIEVPVLQTMRVHKNSEGHAEYLSTIMQDLSQLKTLQADLKRTHQRFELAVEAAQIGVWEWNFATDEVLWAQTCYPVHGLDAKSLGNKAFTLENWRELIHKEDQDEFLKVFKEASASKEHFSLEVRVALDNKAAVKVVRFEGRLDSDTKDPAEYLHGVCWDVTQSAKMRNQMEESLAQFKNLVELAPVGIFLTDATGDCTYINRSWEAFTGLSSSQVKDAGWAEAIPIEEREQLIADWSDATRKAESFEQEIKFKNVKTGEATIQQTKATPILSDNGQACGYIGINIDVTKQKAIEEMHRKISIDARKASEAKTMFLANMSHEIRTPLNSIVGLSDLLCEVERLPKIAKDYVETLRSSSEVLLTLVNDILDLSKIEAGEVQLYEESFSLDSLLEELIDIFSWQAREKCLDLRYYIDPKLPLKLGGDVARIKQILINLVGNALKFTETGNVTIEVLSKLTDVKGKSRLQISVSDTGIGIAKSQQQEVFSQFSQADSQTTRKFGGTGLGLVIVKKLAQLMNGSVEVVSDLGKGSCFEIELELNIVEQPSVARRSEFLKTAKVHILLYGEDEAQLNYLKTILVHWGGSVKVANDLSLASSLLAEESADIFIADCGYSKRILSRLNRVWDQVFQKDSKCRWVVLGSAENYTVADFSNKEHMVFARNPVRHGELLRTLQSILEPGFEEISFSTESSAEPVYVVKEEQNRDVYRILLVDDAPNNRSLIRAYLSKGPYQIDEAVDGQEALGLLKRNEYDLVLMDMQMPVMDGYDATREFRLWEQKNRNSITPVLALSAYAMREQQELSIKAGCTSYLSKPIKKDQLIKQMNLHLLSNLKQVG